MSRVLVIGGGMAGSAAAMAASAGGASVTVVSAHPGATAFTTGQLWPQAGPVPAADFGFAPLPSGARLANVLGELSEPTHAAAAQAAGAIAPGRRVAVVGVRGAPQLLDAAWAADALQRAGVAAEPAAVDLYLSVEECRRSPFAWAAALDSRAEQDRWAQALMRVGSKADLILVPPLVGNAPSSFERVSAGTGRALGELVATTSSVPGLRFSRFLADWVRGAGCTVVNTEVQALEPGRAALSNGAPVVFDAAVLATGRFLGQGVTLRTLFKERLLDLPVSSQASRSFSREQWFGARPGDAGAAFEAGVQIDREQRVVGSDGESLGWLYAAGSVIAGPDRGLGFAWASGVAAGAAVSGGRPQSAVA